MKHGLFLPPFDGLADVERMADLAVLAEGAGWVDFAVVQYCHRMSSRVPGGVVHKLPGDLRETLVTNPIALTAWMDITPLARNEFICWVEDAKQKVTRERRIRRTKGGASKNRTYDLVIISDAL
jgi:hypothetical protein